MAALVMMAEVSSPTKMTVEIMRGPAWSRLRTAAPLIFAGSVPGRGGAMRAAPPTSWFVAVPLESLGAATFFEAMDKQDPLYILSVEASSAQRVSPEIRGLLDYHLASKDLEAVKAKLTASHAERIVAYRVPSLGADEAESRKVFEFAKSLNVVTIVPENTSGSLGVIDKLANEYDINVALSKPADPQGLLKAVDGLSNKVGAAVDTGSWLEQGIKPADGLSILKDRIVAVRLRDRSAPGKQGHNVTLGKGSAGIPAFLTAMYKAGVKPSFVSVEYTGSGDPAADLAKSLDGFDAAFQAVAGDRVGEISRSTPRRGPERLSDKDREGVAAAVPAEAAVKPKKPRKLLVLDLQVAYGGHGSIPAANLALELWGKKTGAFTPEFSNDLDNLKYPKIKEYDAIFLNNNVGQVFPDPQVRAGLLRFVKEGGGLAGYHGAPHASADWAAFGEMLGARLGSHRTPQEVATLKFDDPKSPLTAAFQGKEPVWSDEFYRFTTPPYSRANVHVLLSFDVAKTDMHQKPDCLICERADNDVPVAWIRSYGKGRIFYTSIGHLPVLFESPEMAKFLLSAVQFVLGDLEADTTPSSQLKK
jgi:type 1 glutamine amidotransferase/sugar phosphate isomerase/epimerase